MLGVAEYLSSLKLLELLKSSQRNMKEKKQKTTVTICFFASLILDLGLNYELWADTISQCLYV